MYCVTFRDSALPYIEVGGKVIQIRAAWFEAPPADLVLNRFLELDLVAARPRDVERPLLTNIAVRMLVHADCVVSMSRQLPGAA